MPFVWVVLNFVWFLLNFYIFNRLLAYFLDVLHFKKKKVFIFFNRSEELVWIDFK